MLEFRIEEVGDIVTTPDFWDCQCEQNYIQDKNQPVCEICKAVSDEQPDSRVNEVKNWLDSQR